MALSKVGDTSGALASTEMALAIKPGDEQLLFNKGVYEKYIALEEYRQKLARLADVGAIVPEVKSFLEQTVRDNRIPAQTSPAPQKPRLEGGKLDIVFYIGPSLEPWNPETVKKVGIGGSETAAIEIAKRLAQKGHDVRVYGDCRLRSDGASLEGIFDGVRYLDHEGARDIDCDVLVSSRRPDAVELAGLRFGRSVLWMHDTHYGDHMTPSRAARFDKILTLSGWHRQFVLGKYPFLDPAKVEVTRNGIDLARFDATVERDPHRAVYSSSPDRGLQCLLEIWPQIRRRVPDAGLHIYYGFENWETVADAEGRKNIAHLKSLLEILSTSGVVFHGRMPLDKLAAQMLQSGVWTFPTWFSETSCITAMEAQAAGLRMVTSSLAALNETVGERGVLIGGRFCSSEYKTTFVDEVVRAMEKPDDGDRLTLQRYARGHFGWDNLVEEWDVMLHGLARTESVVPQKEERPLITPVSGQGRIVHAVLDDYATGGVIMDPHDFDRTETTGGGCRPGFLGLVKELSKHGHTVRAFSAFKEATTIDGVEYLPLAQLDQRGLPNVLWAYYDVRMLRGRSGVFRVASHHTYHIHECSFFHVDVNTVPSQAALDVLKPFWAPWSDWVVLPNYVGDVPKWDPVPGRVVYHTSAERGLHHLLRAWPEIKRRVPHASLHVIGRGEKWATEVAATPGVENSEWGRRARAVREGLEAARRAGDVLTMTDVPRKFLLDELSNASVFAFPCSTVSPCETFSASVMECCKIGVPVVLSPADALESVYRGHVLLTASPVEEHLHEFTDAVVHVLEDREAASRFSGLGKSLAARYTRESAGNVLNDIICGRLPVRRA